MHQTLLHFGAGWTAFPRLWIRLQPLTATLHNDRWDAWGEPLESLPATPFAHLTVLGSSDEHDQLMAEISDQLSGDPSGSWIAAETTVDNWSIHDAGGRIWHRLATARGPMVVVEVHPWRL